MYYRCRRDVLAELAFGLDTSLSLLEDTLTLDSTHECGKVEMKTIEDAVLFNKTTPKYLRRFTLYKDYFRDEKVEPCWYYYL